MNLLVGTCPIADNFHSSSFACGNLSILVTYLLLISSDVLATDTGWCPGQMPDSPVPWSGPEHKY